MNKNIVKIISGMIATLCATVMTVSMVFAANVTVTYVTPGRITQKVVPQGTDMTYQGPKDINFDGYAFCGWNVALANVQTDTVATAVYMPIGSESQMVEAYQVYKNLPTGVLSYTTATIDIIPEPTRNLKTTPTPIATPCRINATDTIAMNPVGIPGQTCVVKWYNGSNGQLCWTDVVPYGTTLPDPADPCMDGLEFVGWYGSWTNITEDRSIMACYYKGKRIYFYDKDHNSLGDAWIRTADSSWDALQQYAVDASHGITTYEGDDRVSAPRAKNDDNVKDATKWEVTIW